jgi:hypothetical protein
MVIDQRNAGASVTPTDTSYTLDRYTARLSQASKYTVQQSTTVPSGFANSFKVTSSAATSVGTSDFFLIGQYLEGYNIADLNWGATAASAGQTAKPITISFQVYSSLTGTFGGVLQNNTRDRAYPFTYTISSANTWTSISVTIPGDTSGTWATDSSIGIRLCFGLGVGSTYTATATGAWQATGVIFSASGCVNVVSTSGATWYITGVQLEAGTTASPFEYRQYGTELILCQRYYELCVSGGGSRSTDNYGVLVGIYKVSKRTSSVTNTVLTGSAITAYYQGPNTEGWVGYTPSIGASGAFYLTYSASAEL